MSIDYFFGPFRKYDEARRLAILVPETPNWQGKTNRLSSGLWGERGVWLHTGALTTPICRLFNSSEKRLAQVLLLLAHFGKDGQTELVIPKISQETLAEMVGITRSRAL